MNLIPDSYLVNINRLSSDDIHNMDDCSNHCKNILNHTCQYQLDREDNCPRINSACISKLEENCYFIFISSDLILDKFSQNFKDILEEGRLAGFKYVQFDNGTN